MAKVSYRKLASRAAGGGLNLKVSVVQGASSATALTLTGIRPGDGLLAVLDFNPPTDGGNIEVQDNYVDVTTITAYDQITIGGTIVTNSDQLVVWWYDFD